MGRATSPRYKVPFRRRREGKTNYRKRLALVKSGKPRLVVRKTNKGIIVQFIIFNPSGDLTLVHKTTKHLEKMGWPAKRNTPTAYLLGYLAGKEALKKNIHEAILDIGRHTPDNPSGIVFAVQKGAMDAGVKMKLGLEVQEDRLKGKHIEEFAKKLKEENEEEFKRRFSDYIRKGFSVEEYSKSFEEFFNKIKG